MLDHESYVYAYQTHQVPLRLLSHYNDKETISTYRLTCESVQRLGKAVESFAPLREVENKGFQESISLLLGCTRPSTSLYLVTALLLVIGFSTLE